MFVALVLRYNVGLLGQLSPCTYRARLCWRCICCGRVSVCLSVCLKPVMYESGST